MKRISESFDAYGFMILRPGSPFSQPERIFDMVEEIGGMWAKLAREEFKNLNVAKIEQERAIYAASLKPKVSGQIKLEPTKPKPFYLASSFLKRAVYEMGNKINQKRKHEVLKEAAGMMAQKDGYDNRLIHNIKMGDNMKTFHILYNMIQVEAGNSDGYLYYADFMTRKGTRNERTRSIRTLYYASLHGVPTEYLIGFIYQVGGPHVITNKLKSGERESWYR